MQLAILKNKLHEEVLHAKKRRATCNKFFPRHKSEVDLNKSEVDLNESEVDLNKCEYSLRANLDQSENDSRSI